MAERKPLPDGLASDVRHLVTELRVLRDRAGLSLTALAHRTPYSKSSWERYLNGKTLPPQHAVISLGKLAGADPARLTALWDLANTAWHDGGAPDGAQDTGTAGPVEHDEGPTEPDPPVEGTEPSPGQSAARRSGRRPLFWPVAAVAVAAVAVSAASLFGAFGRGPSGSGDGNGSPAAHAPTRQIDVTCFAESCEGKDPKEAGCDVWTSAKSRIAGVYVELRYSDACKAAWSRISWGRPGDIARVVAANGRSYERKVRYDTDTFSPMVAAPSPATAKACVVLTSGVHGCTGWGGTHHLTDAPNPPASLSSAGATGPTAGQASP